MDARKMSSLKQIANDRIPQEMLHSARGKDTSSWKGMMITRETWWLRMAPFLCLLGQLVGSQGLQNSDGGVCSPSLFVFGASMMDTGENAASTPFTSFSENPPYGRDYWGHPANRLSNGRVITDHLCQALGKPFLNPYLQFGATQFSHGINFASSGSTALSSSTSCQGPSSINFPLQTQIDQFQVFKNISLSRGAGASGFPALENFEQGIYILEFGTNDFTKLKHGYEDEAVFFEDVLSSQKKAIERLYAEGARNIIIFNVLPLGCAPSSLSGRNRKEFDEYGCFSITNTAVSRYNNMLEAYIDNVRRRLKHVNLVVFNLNQVYLDAISNPSHYGLKYVHASCCGAGGGEYNYVQHVHCGSKIPHNGLLATACENPAEYIFWDYLHPTDSFAGHIAVALLSGTYSKPAFKVIPCPIHNS